MNPSVRRVGWGLGGAGGVLRWAGVLGGLRYWATAGADSATCDGTDGKNSNDHNDDDQCGTGYPPADGRFLVLKLLIVRVRAAYARVIRRLTVHSRSALTVLLAALAVRRLSGLALAVLLTTLRSGPSPYKSLCWRRRARVGGGCGRPCLAIPVPEESLAPAWIGVPSSLRTHGPSLCGDGLRARRTKPVVTQHIGNAESDERPH